MPFNHRRSFWIFLTGVVFLAVSFVGIYCSRKTERDRRSTGHLTQRQPRVFMLDPQLLSASKEKIQSGDASVGPAFKKLQSEADKTLKAGPFSVVFKKPLPPSGNKHDYMSMAPYWWPDPDTPDGLPYIRRDGETNPERDQYDRLPFWDMESAVSTLALAYYFTGHGPYAAHASKLIRTWFLDEATYMNPHLNYGEAIKGICEGRAAGIIETRPLFRIADAVGLIAGSESWTEQDQEKLESWYGRYLKWLIQSEIGKSEAEKENNHGTWYEVQVSAIALFLNKTDVAGDVLQKIPKRISSQIEPDGSQPLELERTRAFHYSSMNVEGLFDAATLGEKVGLDIWHFKTEDGRSVRRALGFLTAFAVGEKPWPYPMIRGWEQDRELIAVLLRQASIKYQEPEYNRLIGKLPGVDTLSGRFQLLYPYTTPSGAGNENRK